MRKTVLMFGLLSLIFISGCLVRLPAATVDNNVVDNTVSNNKVDNSYYFPVADKPTDGASQYQYSPSIENSMIDTNWITPGKVNIRNLYLGAQADYVLRIHNGGSTQSIFSVKARQPDNTNVEKLPIDCINWVEISIPSVFILPKSTVDVPITIRMVKDIDMKGKNYEVWLSVIDTSQQGMIQTELCSRWFIATRN